MKQRASWIWCWNCQHHFRSCRNFCCSSLCISRRRSWLRLCGSRPCNPEHSRGWTSSTRRLSSAIQPANMHRRNDREIRSWGLWAVVVHVKSRGFFNLQTYLGESDESLFWVLSESYIGSQTAPLKPRCLRLARRTTLISSGKPSKLTWRFHQESNSDRRILNPEVSLTWTYTCLARSFPDTADFCLCFAVVFESEAVVAVRGEITRVAPQVQACVVRHVQVVAVIVVGGGTNAHILQLRRFCKGGAEGK